VITLLRFLALHYRFVKAASSMTIGHAIMGFALVAFLITVIFIVLS